MSSIFALLLATLAPAWAVDASSTDPNEIMAAVEERDTGDKATMNVHITIADAAGRERTRKVQSRSMKFDAGRKQLMFFEAPADVRNVGLLSIDYDDGAKDDDQWLYLPSLSKTTRISGADKSGSFMGTDLTYADMTSKDPDNYTYEMLDASADVDGQAAWLIEATPRTGKEKTETGYLKTQVWVSKDKLVPLRIKAWVIEGKKLKFTQFEDYKKVDGLWIAHKITVRTVKDGKPQSTSTLVMSDVDFGNEAVVADDFTERRLEKGL